ncbi:MAG: 3-deoxy-D-manno-octulosonic acid transferase [Bacteroidaceae bacterium]|nr:3-deoxy-D-manno-octulosonic acid transferase [Bacteroidaceae bacterium]
MYSIAIFLYSLGVVLVSPFHKKARQMVKGRWDTFRILRKQVKKDERYIWFHTASLGEFEQGRPLIERIRAEHPEYKILLTFFSPSGYEVRKNYAGADIVCYLPFDMNGNVKSFFRLVRPEMAFFIKYEFWANFITACHRRGIPVYSVSSIFRENQIFFRWYGRKYSHMLHRVRHFFVQNEESRELLSKIHIDKVTVAGDTRFDRVLDIRKAAKDLPLVEAFTAGVRHTFVAGSSWAPDEDLFIPYFNEHKEMKLIIAPHVISEEHLRQIEGKLERPALRYSKATEANVASADCLIIDCFGLLSSIYRYGDVAMVGGGFGVGIHNVPEAAVYGIPVIVGPNNRKFQEAQYLLKKGGCREVTDADEFNATLTRLLTNDKFREQCGKVCHDYIVGGAGATDIVMKKIFG